MSKCENIAKGNTHSKLKTVIPFGVTVGIESIIMGVSDKEIDAQSVFNGLFENVQKITKIVIDSCGK